MATKLVASEHETAGLPRLSVDVRLGRADDLRAEVLLTAKLPADMAAGKRLAFAATLRGPQSSRAATLPVRIAVQTVSPQPEAAATRVAGRVVLTEPAYWSPELPMLYRLEGHLHAGDEPVGILDDTIGLRRLGVRGHSLWLDGRRWVPRGVNCDAPTTTEQDAQLQVAHRLGLVAVVTLGLADAVEATFWEQRLLEADRNGHPLFVRLNPALSQQTAEQTVGALARHPAVLAVILPEPLVAMAVDLKPQADTMLLAAEVTTANPPPQSAPAIDLQLAHLSTNDTPAASWRQPGSLPALAWSRTGPQDRGGCDALQRTLASWRLGGNGPPATWDWAGFLIG